VKSDNASVGKDFWTLESTDKNVMVIRYNSQDVTAWLRIEISSLMGLESVFGSSVQFDQDRKYETLP
jgi:hypothetical protein